MAQAHIELQNIGFCSGAGCAGTRVHRRSLPACWGPVKVEETGGWGQGSRPEVTGPGPGWRNEGQWTDSRSILEAELAPWK